MQLLQEIDQFNGLSQMLFQPKDIQNETGNNKEISIIFGKEDRGLTNDELEHAID